jgi:hypothetical protein
MAVTVLGKAPFICYPIGEVTRLFHSQGSHKALRVNGRAKVVDSTSPLDYQNHSRGYVEYEVAVNWTANIESMSADTNGGICRLIFLKGH